MIGLIREPSLFGAKVMISAARPTRSFATNTTASVQAQPTVLAGTVASHRCYILLHSSQPPSDFPSKMSTAVQRALQLKVSRWGGIVNFSWSPDQPIHKSHDTYFATAFSISGRKLEIPELSSANVDEVEEMLRKHIEGPLRNVKASQQDVHLYVCTHGARDCRCGNMGGLVVKALRTEVERRIKADPLGAISQVKVAEVGHVGGHQHAANLLIFPHGEWLGLLTPEDVPEVLDTILGTAPRPFTANHPPLVLKKWRGRMGLGKEEQLQLFASHTN